ncbi:uncharacterized protein MONBRDRAFT_22120 [Monosiga brevicollis MX1]|uniref:PID domain-containing protein n=1 Tax=Monosiga brevicollis TaxID=81824 RepID=A9UPM2_MONBE|nr:uncharacterized protein MONBRDRAFT_22120 [Monosiga brevicollis MX1]EDQ92895.1 predicted protein [Monosiga brevicollis MX1]|eukprot:XP_001742657.1 hypothetical protein [Monosiga brevicollis MX1]
MNHGIEGLPQYDSPAHLERDDDFLTAPKGQSGLPSRSYPGFDSLETPYTKSELIFPNESLPTHHSTYLLPPLSLFVPCWPIQYGEGVFYSFPVTYIGRHQVAKSLRTVEFPVRRRICQEAIARVREASNTRDPIPRDVDKASAKFLDRFEADIKLESIVINISVEGIVLATPDEDRVIAHHRMACISFAAGGDFEDYDQVAYIAKTKLGRICYVFDCGQYSNQVLSTIGQAFVTAGEQQDLEYDEYEEFDELDEEYEAYTQVEYGGMTEAEYRDVYGATGDSRYYSSIEGQANMMYAAPNEANGGDYHEVGTEEETDDYLAPHPLATHYTDALTILEGDDSNYHDLSRQDGATYDVAARHRSGRGRPAQTHGQYSRAGGENHYSMAAGVKPDAHYDVRAPGADYSILEDPYANIHEANPDYHPVSALVESEEAEYDMGHPDTRAENLYDMGVPPRPSLRRKGGIKAEAADSQDYDMAGRTRANSQGYDLAGEQDPNGYDMASDPNGYDVAGDTDGLEYDVAHRSRANTQIYDNTNPLATGNRNSTYAQANQLYSMRSHRPVSGGVDEPMYDIHTMPGLASAEPSVRKQAPAPPGASQVTSKGAQGQTKPKTAPKPKPTPTLPPPNDKVAYEAGDDWRRLQLQTGIEDQGYLDGNYMDANDDPTGAKTLGLPPPLESQSSRPSSAEAKADADADAPVERESYLEIGDEPLQPDASPKKDRKGLFGGFLKKRSARKKEATAAAAATASVPGSKAGPVASTSKIELNGHASLPHPPAPSRKSSVPTDALGYSRIPQEEDGDGYTPANQLGEDEDGSYLDGDLLEENYEAIANECEQQALAKVTTHATVLLPPDECYTRVKKERKRAPPPPLPERASLAQSIMQEPLKSKGDLLVRKLNAKAGSLSVRQSGDVQASIAQWNFIPPDKLNVEED